LRERRGKKSIGKAEPGLTYCREERGGKWRTPWLKLRKRGKKEGKGKKIAVIIVLKKREKKGGVKLNEIVPEKREEGGKKQDGEVKRERTIFSNDTRKKKKFCAPP